MKKLSIYVKLQDCQEMKGKEMFFKKLAKRENMNHFILIGLGNPGREYARTRHNIGYLVIDQLADRWGVSVTKAKFKSLMGEYRRDGQKVILVKPQTFMNNSGAAARAFFQFYKPPLSQMMVIFDDLDLSFGVVRIRPAGGSSGQKGMQSIIQQLGTDKFPRMRVGIGRPPGKMEAVDFILNEFKPSDQTDLAIILGRCADAIEVFLSGDIEKAMTQFNCNILDVES